MTESLRTLEAKRTTFFAVNLSGAERFNAVGLDEWVVGLSAGRPLCQCKYIVVTVQGRDMMYVFPENVKHVDFFGQLGMAVDKESLHSAGEIIVILKPKIDRSITGYSESLAKASLLDVRNSEAYKCNILLPLLGEFFSIRDRFDNEI